MGPSGSKTHWSKQHKLLNPLFSGSDFSATSTLRVWFWAPNHVWNGFLQRLGLIFDGKLTDLPLLSSSSWSETCMFSQASEEGTCVFSSQVSWTIYLRHGSQKQRCEWHVSLMDTVPSWIRWRAFRIGEIIPAALEGGPLPPSSDSLICWIRGNSTIGL